MRLRRLSEEVLVADATILDLARDDLVELKRLALENERRRIRICAHADVSDRLHEMLIVHTRDAYVPPHKHLGKSESSHVVEGRATAVFFDEEGRVTDAVKLGDYASGRPFYFRIDSPLYHTLLIESEFFVFHEVTNGPFVREETVLAPWAPAETDAAACMDYRRQLAANLSG